jgi:hypothetical protein
MCFPSHRQKLDEEEIPERIKLRIEWSKESKRRKEKSKMTIDWIESTITCT